jgi:hypothetical protein
MRDARRHRSSGWRGRDGLRTEEAILIEQPGECEAGKAGTHLPKEFAAGARAEIPAWLVVVHNQSTYTTSFKFSKSRQKASRAAKPLGNPPGFGL